VVAGVEPASPADRAGLVAGDVLLSLDGQAVTGADDLIRILTGEKIGGKVEIELLRERKRQQVSLEPQERQRRAA
jgi:S1-C subfamily serine protease